MKNVEFTAVILASTCGARLYPLTSTGSTATATATGSSSLYGDSDNLDENTSTMQTSLQHEQSVTSHAYMPKHLLPLAGRPILFHLVEHCEAIGMEEIVIAIGWEDHRLGITERALMSMGCGRSAAKSVQGGNGVVDVDSKSTPFAKEEEEWQYGHARIVVVGLPADCGGSADALRYVMSVNAIGSFGSGGKNHVMVLPADLVLYGHLGKFQQGSVSTSTDSFVVGGDSGGGCVTAADSLLLWDALGSLANVHRREYRAGFTKGIPLAMTMLLADVGEEDENGIPVKESAKAKKGGVARDEEEMEYIGISTIVSRNRPPTQRIVFKQSKYNVEEDIHNTGATPKLHIPKARLHSPMNQIMIKSSWSDLHVFCFSPWALKLLLVKEHMKELAKDFVPFLISRQFRGLKASFGLSSSSSSMNRDLSERALDAMLSETMDELNLSDSKRKRASIVFHGDDCGHGRGGEESTCGEEDCPFMVSTHVLSRECSKLSIRASTVPSYMYACREVVTRAIASSAVQNGRPMKDLGILSVPEGSCVDSKFHSILLPNVTMGDKVQIKSCTIGRGVIIGNRCRLNNVVVHDNVSIGENCVLQNSTISEGSIIGNNCNLNECQIGIRAEVPDGTKAKGEGF